MKKKIFWIITIVLVIGIFLVTTGIVKKRDLSESEYIIAVATKGDLESTVNSTGILTPLKTVKIGSQISGNIKDVYVDYNSTVHKDQVIAIIDPAVYAAQVEQAEAHLLMAKMTLDEKQKDIISAKANLQGVKAQLESEKAVFKEAELRYTRLKNLRRKKIGAESDLDKALANRDNARGAVKIAKARLQTAESDLKGASAREKGAKANINEKEAALRLSELKLNYCTIKSPIDGVVISKNVDVGQTVAATLESPVLFTIAEDLSKMKLEVDVSEADVGLVGQNQKLTFSVDAFPSKEFKSSVKQIRNAASAVENVVTYKIIADVDNKQYLLRPGMTSNVTIFTANAKGIIKIPNTAFRFQESRIKKTKKREVPSGNKNTNTVAYKVKQPLDDVINTKKTEVYNSAVKEVNLDADQKKQFKQIIKNAGSILNETTLQPEAERDWDKAIKKFLIQTFTELRNILHQGQKERLDRYISQLKEMNAKIKKNKVRRTNVYILDGNYKLKKVEVVAGMTDDSETQIVSGLKPGDNVVVGLKNTTK